MTDRGGQKWSYYSGSFKGKPRYDGDVWYSENINGAWSKPICLPDRINTASGEDEPNISPDGQRIVFQSWRTWWESTGGPYYYSVKNGNEWSTPIGLGGGITDFFKGQYNVGYYYSTDGMSISPDNNTYIVSAGQDYEGNLDLFISQKENNAWGKMKKMNISTDKDERSIFIAGDGKTIYFASNGYGGFGGLDIFKATLNKDGTASNITNIGAPFNTAKDDYGFIITASGTEVYFIREGDIFYSKLLENNKLAPSPTVIIAGKVVDCKNKPLETILRLTDKNENMISCKSSISGDYIFTLPEEAGTYKIYNDKNTLLKTVEITKKNEYQEFSIILTDCSTTQSSFVKSKPARKRK